MQYYLDVLFSSTLVLTIVIMVLMLLFVGLSFLNPFNIKWLNTAYRICMYVIPVAGLVLLNFTYYGFSNQFNSIGIGSTTICLFEEYERGGETGDETICRMHILDKKTGKEQLRFYAGYSSHLIDLRHDSVCYEYNDDIVMYDARNKKELWRIAKEEWGNHFPELKEGVEQISDRRTYENLKVPYLIVDAKNGHNYYIDPFRKKTYSKEPFSSMKGYWSTGYDIRHWEDNRDAAVLSFTTIANSKRETIWIKGKRENIKSEEVKEEDTFLDPRFLGLDSAGQVFVFAHYTNTDKTHFTVEAKDMDLKTLWKRTNDELGTSDYFSTRTNMDVFATEGGMLYFNSGGFVLAMDIKTGNVKWKTRL